MAPAGRARARRRCRTCRSSQSKTSADGRTRDGRHLHQWCRLGYRALHGAGVRQMQGKRATSRGSVEHLSRRQQTSSDFSSIQMRRPLIMRFPGKYHEDHILSVCHHAVRADRNGSDRSAKHFVRRPDVVRCSRSKALLQRQDMQYAVKHHYAHTGFISKQLVVHGQGRTVYWCEFGA